MALCVAWLRRLDKEAEILMVERGQYLCVMRAPTTYAPSRLQAPLRKRLWQPIELHESGGTVKLRPSASE